MERNKYKRWQVALSAVGLHVSIGSIYGWSQVAVGLKNHPTVAWSLQEITYTFSIAIFFLGLSAASFGYFVEKYGPRIAGRCAALLFLGGFLLSGWAIQVNSLILLYVGYGFFVGSGTGIGYITPVSTLLKWFPDRRGLAMGMAIMGFGFGAALYVWLLETILPLLGIESISDGLMVLGGFYFVVMMLAAQKLERPSQSWTEEVTGQSRVKPLSEVLAREAVKTPQFYCLWIMLFINITCGIGVISLAKHMGIEMGGMTASQAAAMVMLMSIFNGMGRISWASISDYMTRPLTYTVFFLIQIFSFYFITHIHNALLFQMIIFLILTCYGGGFALIPAYIGDILERVLGN